MTRKENNIHSHKEEIVNKFFEEFEVKPSNKTVNLFKDFLNSYSNNEQSNIELSIIYKLFETWLNQKYTPDMFATGGTISTMVSNEGARLPDNTMQSRLLTNTGKNTRKKLIVYDYALDSSNQTLETQERLMSKLGEVAFKDIKDLQNLTLHFKKPGKYIHIDQIPYYFNFPKPSGPGTIVTHGTDTLEENAAMSSYLMLPKTIVWTGSWASPTEEGNDALTNIEKARSLAHNSLTPIGVYVVIGDEIHLATRVKKINTHPWESLTPVPYSKIKPWRKKTSKISYFASIDDNPAGYFNKNGYIYFNTEFLRNWEELLIKRFDSYYPLQKVNTLKPGYVEHILINQYTPGEVFYNMINRLNHIGKRCGAIIEGNISGNPHYNDFVEVLHNIQKDKEIFVLSTDKTKLSSAYKNLNNISAAQLRIKLSALLGRNDVNSNNMMFLINDNISGEIIENHVFEDEYFIIPREFYENGDFIIAFPGMTKEIIHDATKSLLNKQLLSGKAPVLLINGYGDGHIPIGCLSMEERLIQGFDKTNKKMGEKLLINLKNNSTTRQINNFSINNILTHLSKTNSISNDQARSILREALMQTDDLLKLLGEAINNGIEVLIGSKADYAIPNLNAYEIGNILELIGVKALNVSTKEFFDLLNKE